MRILVDIQMIIFQLTVFVLSTTLMLW